MPLIGHKKNSPIVNVAPVSGGSLPCLPWEPLNGHSQSHPDTATSEGAQSKHFPKLFVPEIYSSSKIKALRRFPLCQKPSLVAMAAGALYPDFTGNTLNAFILLGVIELKWSSSVFNEVKSVVTQHCLSHFIAFLCCFI